MWYLIEISFTNAYYKLSCTIAYYLSQFVWQLTVLHSQSNVTLWLQTVVREIVNSQWTVLVLC